MNPFHPFIWLLGCFIFYIGGLFRLVNVHVRDKIYTYIVSAELKPVTFSSEDQCSNQLSYETWKGQHNLLFISSSFNYTSLLFSLLLNKHPSQPPNAYTHSLKLARNRHLLLIRATIF